MIRQLTKEDILNAKALYLYDNEILYVELSENNNVYGITPRSKEWFIKNNFYVSTITKEDAIMLVERWEKELSDS